MEPISKRHFSGKRAGAVLLCLCLLLSLLTGCGHIREIVPTVVTLGVFPVDVNGVTIGARPSKAVVLSPSLADVVCALGFETQLAAGSNECSQDSLRSLPKIDGSDPQAVLGVGPDLVLGWELPDSMTSALAAANIPVVQIEPAVDRESYETLFGKVASVFAGGGDGTLEGVSVAQDIFTTLDNVNRVVPKDKITTACYLYDLTDKAVTGDMLGSTIMSYAGVTNVFQSLKGGVYDFESLRISNPTNIFCLPGLADEIRADERFAEFQAVQNDRIYELEPRYMEWQGRTVAAAALEISGKCFPELLEESSMEVTDPVSQIEEEVSSQVESSRQEEETSSRQEETEYETLELYSNGDQVLAMQDRLSELGYLTEPYDGYFGDYTLACLKDFQEQNGLEPDGVADSETLRVLFSSKAKPAAQEDAPPADEESSQSEESSEESTEETPED